MKNLEQYTGHPLQVRGVEEYRLCSGKGDGMHLLQVRNGSGLEFTVSPDRCADLVRVSLHGVNFSFMGPCGYVAPQYYDSKGEGFLKSFTAGFLTTCGLTAVGDPCTDAGKELPLHGSIGNTPAEQYYHCVESREGQEEILIGATIRQAEIFGERLEMKREWRCPIGENTLYLTDIIRNYGDRVTPHMILYHMNMGYPILSEEASLYIPSETVAPRDARAAEGLNAWNVILPPQPQFKEQCYYHTFRRDEEAYAAIFNPAVQKGVKIVFHPEELDCFTQWKMMGWGDYVMGLEPGNCYVEGRDVMREKGILKELAPGEEVTYHLEFHFLEDDTSLSK